MNRKGVNLSIEWMMVVVAGLMLLVVISSIVLAGKENALSSLAFLNPSNFIPGF